ncbi:MAG: isoprenylcysteine carboxylmethyltransferase family protein [Nevskia sp.]
MARVLSLVYGVVCYAIFFGVFLYLIGFVADAAVPKTVSSGEGGAAALAIDLALIALFGLQHSVMARPGFKRRLTRWLPEAVERSSYVLATNAVLVLLFLGWQPLPGELWRVTEPAAVQGLYALMGLGWLLVLVATFLTHHFDLFGLRQVWLNARRRTYTPVAFKEILLYRWLRHPMMLGLLIAFWAAPVMTMSHLLFSAGMSVYIVIGMHFEERGLRAALGQPYVDYMRRTVRILPFY